MVSLPDTSEVIGVTGRRCDPWYHLVGTKAKSRESLTQGSRWTGSTTRFHWQSSSHQPQFHGQCANDQVPSFSGTAPAPQVAG